MTTTGMKDRALEWVEENPLRRWRKREGMSMMRAAAMIGVGMSTVQLWEQGAHLPKTYDAIADVLGVKPTTLARAWREWYNDRPTP
jgi:transcriptional regulator with XRE-family HTH domain